MMSFGKCINLLIYVLFHVFTVGNYSNESKIDGFLSDLLGFQIRMNEIMRNDESFSIIS